MANKLNRLLSSKERRYKPVASTTSLNKDTTNPTKTPSSQSKDTPTRIVSTEGSPSDVSSSSLLDRQSTHGTRRRGKETETVERRKFRGMSNRAKSADSPTAKTVETTVYTAKYNGRVSQVDYNDAKKGDQDGVKHERRGSISSKLNEKRTKSGRSASRGRTHDNKLSDSDRWSSIPDKLFWKNPLSRKPASSDKDNKREKERGNESEKNDRTSEARDVSGKKSSSRWSSKEARGERDKTTTRGKHTKEDDKQSSKTKSAKEEDDIAKKKSSSSSSRLKPSVFMKRSQSTKAFEDSGSDYNRSRSKHRPSNKASEHSSSKRGKDLDESSSKHNKEGRNESFSSRTRGIIQSHTLPDDFAIPPTSSTYRRADTQSQSKSSDADHKDVKLRSSHTSRPKSLSRSLHSIASSRDRKEGSDAATAGGRATVTGLEIVPQLASPSDDNMQRGLEIIPMKQPNHTDGRETRDKKINNRTKSRRRGSSAGTSDCGMSRRKSEIDLLTSQVSLLDFNSSISHNDTKGDNDDDDDNDEDDNGKRRNKEKVRSSLTISNLDASSRSGMSRTARSNEKNNRLSKSSQNNNTSGRNDIIWKNSYNPKNKDIRVERNENNSKQIGSSQKDDDISLRAIMDKRINQRRSWSASPPRGRTVDGKNCEGKIDNNRRSQKKDPIGPNILGSSSIQALAPSRVDNNNPSRNRQSREGHARRPGHHRRLSGLQRRNSKTRSISPSTGSMEERSEDRKPSAGPHGTQRPCAKNLADSTPKMRDDIKSASRPDSPMQDRRHQDDDRIRRSGPYRLPSLAQRRHSNKYPNALPDLRDRSPSEDERRSEGETAASNRPLRRPSLAQRRQSKGDSPRPLSLLKNESYPEGEVEASPGCRPAHITRRNSRSLNTTSPTRNKESTIESTSVSPRSRQERVRVTNLGGRLRAPRDVREINTLKSENQSRDEGVRHNRPIRRTTVAHAPDDKLNSSLRSGGSIGNPRREIESGNHLASMPNILGDDGSQGTDMAQPSIISPDYEKIKRLCESIQRQQNLGNSKSNKATTGQGLDDNALKDLRPLYKDSSAMKPEANEVKSLPLPILRHSRIARIPTISPPKKVPPPPPPPRKSISEGQALPQNALLHSGASVTSGVNQGACSGTPLPQPMSQKVTGNEQSSSFPQNSTCQHVIPATGLPSQNFDPRVVNNGPSPANTMTSAPERSLQRSNSSNTIGDTARQARNRKLMALAGGGEKQRVSGLSYNDRDGGRGLYTGEVDQWGRPNGEGKIEYDSGEVFDGQWVNGNRVAPTFCHPTAAPIIPGGSLAPNGGASIAPGNVAPGMYGGGASVAPGSIMGGMYGGGGFMMNPFAQAQFIQQQQMAMGYPMMMQGQGQGIMQHPAQIMHPQMMPRPQFAGQQQKPNETQDQESV